MNATDIMVLNEVELPRIAQRVELLHNLIIEYQEDLHRVLDDSELTAAEIIDQISGADYKCDITRCMLSDISEKLDQITQANRQYNIRRFQDEEHTVKPAA